MRENRLPTPIWLFVLLAAIGVFAPGTKDKSSAGLETSTESSASAAAAHADEEASYCNTRVDRVLEAATDAANGNNRVRRTPFIAILPDPIDSGLYYDYDALLDTVSSSIEEQGWDRDLSFIPWNDPAARTDDERDRSSRCRLDVPGALLFRRQQAEAARGTEYLAVFVVGETPTAGVHRNALKAALDRSALFASGTRDPFRLPLLGPTFSGSALSIRSALVAWNEKWNEETARKSEETARKSEETARKSEETACEMGSRASQRAKPWRGIEIASGSATAEQVESFLRSKDDGSDTLPTGTRFLRTIPTDDATAQAFFDEFLHGTRGVGVEYSERGTGENVHPRVALVVESGTAYGHSLARQRPLVIDFPPHIATLRAAYDKQQASGDKSAEAHLKLAPPGLGASLNEKEPPRAVESNLSPKSAVAHDVVFANLVQRRLGSGVQYVGVGATDVADLVFVAHRIRQSSPDVRLFTFSHDALLLHWAFSSDLDGTLVATGFPWLSTDTAGHLVPVNSDVSGGVHDAMSWLLSDLCQQCAFDGSSTPCACPLVAPRDPDVWVGVVGKGNLWPLWKSGSASPAAQLPDPKPWKLAFALALVASLYSALAYLVSLINPSWPWQAAALRIREWPGFTLPMPYFLRRRHLKGAAVDSVVSFEQHLFHAAMFSGLTLVVFVWTWVSKLAVGRSAVLDWFNWCLTRLGQADYWILLFVSAVAWVRLGRFRRDEPRRIWGYRAVAVAFLTALTIFVAVATAQGLKLQPGFEVLTYDRLTELTNSVNPLVPASLLYGVLQLFYTGNLIRLQSASVSVPKPRLPEALTGSRLPNGEPSLPLARLFARVGVETPVIVTAERNVAQALRGLVESRSRVGWALSMLVGASAVFVAILLRVVRLSTVEGPSIDGLFAVLIPFCWLSLGTSLVWVLFFQFRLGALLRVIGGLPLARAFARLPHPLTGPLPMLLAAGPGVARDLAPWVRRYEEVVHHVNPMGVVPQLAPSVVNAQFGRDSADAHSHTAPIATDTFRLLIAGGEHVVERLVQEWQADRSEESLPTWVNQAEEFVAALVVFVVRETLHGFRSYFAILSGGSLLLGLAVASYVFEPQAVLMSIVLSMLLVFVIAGVAVYLLLDRDEVLSRLSSGEKDGIDFAFVRWAFTWAVVPLASAVLLRYPAIWGRLASWFGPLAGW